MSSTVQASPRNPLTSGYARLQTAPMCKIRCHGLPGKRDSMRSRIVRRFEWPGVEFIAENGGGAGLGCGRKGERLSEKLGFYTEATAAAAGLTDGDPGNYCARPRLDLGDSAGRAIFVTRAGLAGGEGRRRARALLDDSSSVRTKNAARGRPQRSY
jgi:hypothetical protein